MLNKLIKESRLDDLKRQLANAQKSLDMLDNHSSNPDIVSNEKDNIARLVKQIKKLDPNYGKMKSFEPSEQSKIDNIASKVIDVIELDRANIFSRKGYSKDEALDVEMNRMKHNKERVSFIKKNKSKILKAVNRIMSSDTEMRRRRYY